MKKLLLLAMAVLGFQVSASAAADVEREPFVGTDGVKYYLRSATVADIDDPKVGIGDGVKADRRDRVVKKFFGVFIIETEGGEYAGKLFTGRMPLGVQPWPCEKGSADERRLSIILGFYELLLNLQGIGLSHRNVVRSSAPDVRIELFDDVRAHAATAVIPGAPFNTVAIQDALAVLSGKLGLGVAPDADITPAGVPALIVSAGTVEPVLADRSSPSRVFVMPYYAGIEGMRYTTVTSMAGIPIPELPERIAGPLAEYVASLSAAK